MDVGIGDLAISHKPRDSANQTTSVFSYCPEAVSSNKHGQKTAMGKMQATDMTKGYHP